MAEIPGAGPSVPIQPGSVLPSPAQAAGDATAQVTAAFSQYQGIRRQQDADRELQTNLTKYSDEVSTFIEEMDKGADVDGLAENFNNTLGPRIQEMAGAFQVSKEAQRQFESRAQAVFRHGRQTVLKTQLGREKQRSIAELQVNLQEVARNAELLDSPESLANAHLRINTIVNGRAQSMQWTPAEAESASMQASNAMDKAFVIKRIADRELDRVHEELEAGMFTHLDALQREGFLDQVKSAMRAENTQDYYGELLENPLKMDMEWLETMIDKDPREGGITQRDYNQLFKVHRTEKKSFLEIHKHLMRGNEIYGDGPAYRPDNPDDQKAVDAKFAEMSATSLKLDPNAVAGVDTGHMQAFIANMGAAPTQFIEGVSARVMNTKASPEQRYEASMALKVSLLQPLVRGQFGGPETSLALRMADLIDANVKGTARQETGDPELQAAFEKARIQQGVTNAMTQQAAMAGKTDDEVWDHVEQVTQTVGKGDFWEMIGAKTNGAWGLPGLASDIALPWPGQVTNNIMGIIPLTVTLEEAFEQADELPGLDMQTEFKQFFIPHLLTSKDLDASIKATWYAVLQNWGVSDSNTPGYMKWVRRPLEWLGDDPDVPHWQTMDIIHLLAERGVDWKSANPNLLWESSPDSGDPSSADPGGPSGREAFLRTARESFPDVEDKLPGQAGESIEPMGAQAAIGRLAKWAVYDPARHVGGTLATHAAAILYGATHSMDPAKQEWWTEVYDFFQRKQREFLEDSGVLTSEMLEAGYEWDDSRPGDRPDPDAGYFARMKYAWAGTEVWPNIRVEETPFSVAGRRLGKAPQYHIWFQKDGAWESVPDDFSDAGVFELDINNSPTLQQHQAVRYREEVESKEIDRLYEAIAEGVNPEAVDTQTFAILTAARELPSHTWKVIAAKLARDPAAAAEAVENFIRRNGTRQERETRGRGRKHNYSGMDTLGHQARALQKEKDRRDQVYDEKTGRLRSAPSDRVGDK